MLLSRLNCQCISNWCKENALCTKTLFYLDHFLTHTALFFILSTNGEVNSVSVPQYFKEILFTQLTMLCAAFVHCPKKNYQ
jgi:hypothetical protein